MLCCKPLLMLVAALLHGGGDFQLPWCQPCSAEPHHQPSGRAAAAAAGRSPRRSADGVGLKLMARQPRGSTARQWHGLPSWQGVLFAEEVQVSRPAWHSSRRLHRELQGSGLLALLGSTAWYLAGKVSMGRVRAAAEEGQGQVAVICACHATPRKS